MRTLFDETADEALRAQLKVMRSMGATGDNMDAKTAQNVLHEDLGYFKSKSAEYSLDEATRDKLLAHTRQDAAHAVYAAMRAAREVRALKALMVLTLLFVIACLALILWRS